MGKKYLIAEEDANAILQHLGQSPYREVFEFCDTLRNLEEVPDVESVLARYHGFILKMDLWRQFEEYLTGESPVETP